jgi:hypothetical protein
MLFRRNWLLLLLACLALALAVGCGGGGDDDDDGDGGSGGGQTTAPADGGDDGGDDGGTDGDPLDGLTFQVNETFYHSGFEVELGQGTVESQEEGVFSDEVNWFLTIEGTFTNNGDSEFSFAPEMSIVQGTKNYSLNFSTDAPTVGSGLTGEGELIFNIDEEFDYEQAKLVVGSGDETRAEIPFAPSAGELIALAPEEDLPATGTISLTLIDLNFTNADLRYDVPGQWRTVDEGDRALTLHFSATSRKTGNWNIFANEFALTKPNGSSVPVDGSSLGSLPGSEAGTTTEDLSLRFLVDAEAEGEYTLRYTPADYWTDGGPTEGTLVFSIE